MTKLSFVSLFIFLSASAFADCQYFDGTITTTVKDGATVSLREPTKSLDGMTIQDQDGLSTCYANTTSAILKSVLPNHPDVSYTHAAIMNTTRGWEAEWKDPNHKYVQELGPDKKEDFTGGGWVCETIAGMKKAGGACPKNLSLPENTQYMDPDVQQSLMVGLGSYFDNINLIKDDPVKFAQLKNDLSLAIEAINVESTALTHQCEDRRKSKFPVFGPVRSLMEDAFYDNITDPTACTSAKTEALKKLMAPKSIIGNDRLDIIPSDETLAQFEGMLESDPLIVKDLEGFMLKGSRLSDYPDLVKNLGPKLNALLLTLVPDEAVKKECPAILGQSPLIKESIDSESEYFLFRIKDNKNKPCTDLLQPYAASDLLDPAKNPNSCLSLAPTNFETIMAGIKPLMEVQMPINQLLLPTLLNPESRYANQIVTALMPKCLDKTNLIPLDDISCADFPFCDRQVGYNPIYNYTGPAKGCYSTDVARKIMRTKTMIGINQGRALGISVCTAFMDNPDIKTNNCRDGLPAGEKHSYHEMSLTGFRCKADKIEYELTNSWGSRCNENKNIECQKDEYENTLGPFWVKEDALIDSTNDITTVTVRKK